MISEKQMENYKKLCRDAQNGPWYATENEGMYSIEVNAGADIARNITKNNAEFIAISRTALPRLLAKVQELQHRLDQAYSHAEDCCAEVKQLEKEADWLALHAPADAYTCCAGYDMTCACDHLIDFKNKKRCPFWIDYYGEYKDACPNDTFEEWKDYVFDDYDGQVNCAFDKQKCWREAARKSIS